MLGRANRLFKAALPLVLLLLPAFSGRAQAPAATLESLQVEIWPDFDRPSVLVLLTGTLSGDTTLPAKVTIPLPEEASLNAVARIDVSGGMFADIDVDDSVPGQLTLNTTEPQFRVEYYQPYVADGDERSFTFDWQSDLTIEQMAVSVQQPAQAGEMTVDPAPAEVTIGRFGLSYHNQDPQTVAGGERYLVQTDYTMIGSQLTSEFLNAQALPVSGAELAQGSTATDGLNWTLILAVAGGLLVIAALFWFLISRRQPNRVVKPRPVRVAKPAKSGRSAGFCHECGQALEPDDRFCRNCGTPVKGK